MQFRVFQYPLPAPSELDELNAFLTQHRVTSVEHRWIEDASGPQLVFLVRVASGAAGAGNRERTPKTDYREVLSPEDFTVFCRLRDARKQIAAEKGVPVYSVFTNAQLAEIVQRSISSVELLSTIDGVSDTRAADYGERILSAMEAGE
ncbi:MAG: HRDC domain-containing protein [Planctomycetota bacterium]